MVPAAVHDDTTPDAPTFQAVEARYAELSAAQLEQVAQQFGADYILVDAPTGVPDPPVFSNATYRVFRVRRLVLAT